MVHHRLVASASSECLLKMQRLSPTLDLQDQHLHLGIPGDSCAHQNLRSRGDRHCQQDPGVLRACLWMWGHGRCGPISCFIRKTSGVQLLGWGGGASFCHLGKEKWEGRRGLQQEGQQEGLQSQSRVTLPPRQWSNRGGHSKCLGNATHTYRHLSLPSKSVLLC